jgi:type VI protein secretion system component VasF
MTRRVSRTSHQQILMHRWWVRALVAVALIGVAYGFASLAIDSGSLLEYLLTVVFVWWAFHNAIRAVRFAFSS